MPTWEESVQTARAAARQAVEGRFTIGRASFEQFAPFGRGYLREGPWGDTVGRTLQDFADEIGVAYSTLNAYRGTVAWWFEQDPLTLWDEIGVPAHIDWSALKVAKTHWAMSVDFREALEAEGVPANGKVWTLGEVEYLARMRGVRRRATQEPTEVEVYDRTVTTARRVAARLARLGDDLDGLRMDDRQRDLLRAELDRAAKTLTELRERLSPVPA